MKPSKLKSDRKISSSGVLMTAVSLIINLQYGIVNGAAMHNDRDNKPSKEICNKVCSTSKCLSEAQLFLKNMDHTADPCDNFYQFVCGNFIKDVEIPDEDVEVNTFVIMNNELENDLIHQIKTEIKPNDSRAVKKLKIHYNNCLNESSIEAEGTKPLLELLEKLGGWPLLQNDCKEDNSSWLETGKKISASGLKLNFPFDLLVSEDSANTSKTNLKIKSFQTTVTDSYFSGDSQILKAYEDYMVDIAVMLGASRDAALQDMKECLDFEVKLHKIRDLPGEFLNINAIDNRWTIKELFQKYPSISWLKILNNELNPSNVFVNESDTAEVWDLKYVSKIGQLIKNTPNRVLVNFQFWQVINALINFMPKKFDERKLIFDEVYLGINKRPNRETWCLRKIQETLSVAVSAMYVKNFNKNIKDTVNELVQNIKSQTKTTLEKVPWMDKITRKSALEKLDGLDSLIAYPDELLDDIKVDEYYKDLKIHSGSYIDDFIKITAFLKEANYKQLRRPDGKQDWTVDAGVAIINVFYFTEKNRIVLPAGILRGFFNPSERPKYINYGSMGSLIGQDIIHAVDTMGSNYDKNGNMNNWWSNETKEEFNNKSDCIINQYSNYTISQIGEKMNGNLTVSANIADIAGIKLSYHAYREWIIRKKIIEPCLPELNYTPQQMFWISAATTWCSKSKDEYLRTVIHEDYHSPNEARVSVAFTNFEEFSNDFHCKVGSKMNPEKKCNIW